MRKCRLLLIILLCGLSLQATAAPRFPITLTDARGVSVTMRRAPQRIISLSPGVTEMLFALGLGNSVVGDTTSCNYPPAAKRVTKIGDFQANYEKVIALHPDLIVADNIASGQSVTRLAQLKQPMFAIQPTTYRGVEDSLRVLGHLTGTDRRAARIIAQMEDSRRLAAALAARDTSHPRILIIIGMNPLWTAGGDTFIDDVVRLAGGTNVATSLRSYAPLSKERALADAPDWVLASPGDQAALRRDPALRALPAVRAGRLFFVTDGDMILRPGPRLGDALLQVARALHPGAK